MDAASALPAVAASLAGATGAYMLYSKRRGLDRDASGGTGASFDGQLAAGVNMLANKDSVLRRDQVAGSMGAYADLFEGKTGKHSGNGLEGDGAVTTQASIDKRREGYRTMVNNFYDLVTDFYERLCAARAAIAACHLFQTLITLACSARSQCCALARSLHITLRMRILLFLAAAAAFQQPPTQHSSRLNAAKGDLDDDLSPEDMAKFAAQAPSENEQAALFAQLKEQFAAIEGSTYGGARDEDYFEEEDKTLEAELRKAGGRLSKQDQRDVDRAALEATFERAKEDFKSTVEKMKEDDLAVTNIKRAELEEEMAAEARAFETRMDALAREAGVDPRGPLPEFDEDVIVTLDDVLAEPAPVANVPVSNAVRVCGAKGGALQELVVDELKKLGVQEVSVGDAKRGNTGTLVLVDAGEAEAKRLVETARPRRVVVASRQGVTRSGEFAFLFRKGALDGARGVEGAAKLALQKIGEGGESVVVRLGEAKGASGSAVVEVGDTLDEATSVDVAAAALARCCLDARVANATIAVSGADASVDWSDLLLKADGPELLRRPARASENEVLSWVREWATLWTKKGDNARRLTTPVDVVPTPNGAELVFVDKRAPKRSKAGGVRLVVEAVDGVRVRAVRGTYSEGIAVKAMSEDLILARLDEDMARTFG